MRRSPTSSSRSSTELTQAPAWLPGHLSSTTHEWMGSLIAQVDCRDAALHVGYHKVTVEIHDQIVRTTIEESFVNTTNTTLTVRRVYRTDSAARRAAKCHCRRGIRTGCGIVRGAPGRSAGTIGPTARLGRPATGRASTRRAKKSLFAYLAEVASGRTARRTWPKWFFALQGSCRGTLKVPEDSPPDEPAAL